jgi:hypothetical protein
VEQKKTSDARRLSGLDRDVLAVVKAGGLARTLTTVALASAVDAPVRSVERALARLRKLELLETERKGPRPATRALTVRGRALELGDPLALTGRTDQAEEGVFRGDAMALETALLISHFQKRQSMVDLAKEYIDRATPAELKRLLSLQDEHGLYPEWSTPTGHASLDEGLKQAALNNYRRERSRAQVLESL